MDQIQVKYSVGQQALSLQLIRVMNKNNKMKIKKLIKDLCQINRDSGHNEM